jgi:hypothetical protein
LHRVTCQHCNEVEVGGAILVVDLLPYAHKSTELGDDTCLFFYFSFCGMGETLLRV